MRSIRARWPQGVARAAREPVLKLAGALRLVHRRIRVRDEAIGAAAVVWIESHADAGAHLDSVLQVAQRLADAGDRFTCDFVSGTIAVNYDRSGWTGYC